MSTSFRYARLGDLPEVGRLAAHSFPKPSRTPAWWLEQLREPLYGGRPEDTLWIGEEKGRIVAACQLHPLREWIAGEEVPVMGLGTVCISPAHRRRGLAGRLVARALEAARERGDLASALFPFRASFYQKLGYGLAGEAHQYLVAPENLPDGAERMAVELVETEAGRKEVAALYTAWAARQTGQLVRSTPVWRQLLEPGERVLAGYRGESGRLEGYALAAYRVDLSPQERFLEVEELVWQTSGARRGLLAWLGSLGDQWRRLLLRSLPAQRLGDQIREPRLDSGSAPGWRLWFPSATLLLGPMFRLLDVERAWAHRRVSPDVALTLGLDLHDEHLPVNGGGWRLRLENGRVHVEHGGAGPVDLAVGVDIATLSRLYVGALSPSAALEADLMTVDRPQRLPELDRALLLPQPWTFDRF